MEPCDTICVCVCVCACARGDQLMEDDAMASLDRLISDGQEGTFDMAFLDADKRKYGKCPLK